MPGITCISAVPSETRLTFASTTTSAWVRVAIITAILFLTPALAFADMCPTDYLPNVVALGSCTIGNLTLDLSGYSAGEPTFPAQFVPTAAPNPGFELLFPELADCSTCDNPEVNFSYSPMVGGGLSTGSTVTMLLNPFYSSDPTLQALGLLANMAFPEWVQEPKVQGSPSIDLNSYSFSASQSYSQPMNVTQTGSDHPTVGAFAPAQTVSGGLSAYGHVQDGLATVEPQPNAEVTFAAVVPEPQSVYLLATVSFLLILPLRRLFQKRSHAD